MDCDRIVEFSFESVLAETLDRSDVLALARRIWRANMRAGLTGVFRYDRGAVAQTIEGPGNVVLPLAARILSDARHGRIVVRVFGPVQARRFADWRVEGLGASPVAGQSGAPPRLVCLGAPERPRGPDRALTFAGRGGL